MKPFLLVNAGSGGGTAQAPVLEVARRFGIDHHVVTPGEDFGPVLQAAVDGGADMLAAAGGDGTLCAVADVAMTHGLPMIVVPAGTRNHFALDLGLDLEDPAGVLAKCLHDGYLAPVDVGSVNGRTFLNNVSLGVYAQAAGSEGYREHKVTAMVRAASEAMHHDRGGIAHLSLQVPAGGVAHDLQGAAVLMVVNNAYSPSFSPGRRLRPRLDRGEVWVYAGGGLDHEADPIVQIRELAARLATRATMRVAFGAPEVVVQSDVATVPVAVDGEVRPDLVAPFTFASRHRALQLVLPDDPAPVTVGIDLSW